MHSISNARSLPLFFTIVPKCEIKSLLNAEEREKSSSTSAKACHNSVRFHHGRSRQVREHHLHSKTLLQFVCEIGHGRGNPNGAIHN
jgi:hypothetical protein